MAVTNSFAALNEGNFCQANMYQESLRNLVSTRAKLFEEDL